MQMEFLMKVFEKLTQLPIWAHGLGLVAVFGVFNVVKARLDALYAASGHPVDYATGQTTFDAQRVKGFYDVMDQAGTLGIYVQTQIFDYVFMLTLAAFGAMLGTFVARAGRQGSWARRIGLTAAIAALFGAVMDALENGVSFVMLADPAGFADWLVLPYSGFAAIKFALIGLALLCVAACLIIAALGRVFKRPSLG
jgi:hypothetical protein